MKKIISFLIILFSLSPFYTYGASIHIISEEEAQELSKEVTRGESFIFFASFYEDYVPESTKYIQLNFKDASKETELYTSLQTLVYLDLIKNSEVYIHPSKKIDIYTFSVLANKILGVTANNSGTKSELKDIITTKNDLRTIENILNSRNQSSDSGTIDSRFQNEQIEIFQDVYSTILNSHYDRKNISEEDLIYSAIEGLAEGAGDQYTTYFPPTENKNFQEAINGEYEGIGSYVEMMEPGKLIIVSPIVDSPSEKAGLKGGDRVTHVNGKEITENISINEAVSWIKGPEGTSVTLTINRDGKILEIEVKREKIVIHDIEYEFLKYNTLYIQIKNFGANVSRDFTDVVEVLAENPQIDKVVIDVRNNPGGYLGQVSRILSHFVPAGEPTAIVDYGSSEEVYRSNGYDIVDFSQYDIRLLQNSGSASASEILVGTIKDYYPEALVIGEKSFGKGSVQTIKSYTDGSSLKITTAKWFTGKTRIGIDKVGIEPDLYVELDEISLEKGKDTQLETALKK